MYSREVTFIPSRFNESRDVLEMKARSNSVFSLQQSIKRFALFFIAIGYLLIPQAEAAIGGLRTEANKMVEVSFTAKRPHPDPFNDVTLDARFTDPNGRECLVPAYWAGGNRWKARYASPVSGTHHFSTLCSDRQDRGLHNVRGKVEIKKYHGNNPLYAHGPIRVNDDHRHLVHEDGTPFFWLGDTWWMGLSGRLRWPEDVQKLGADRKAKGFNVIQLVAGLFPDMHPFDPRGANEAGFPWETNYSRIRPEYFDAADKRLMYMVDEGFIPCIVGAWGYFLPWMGVEKAKAHWRYLIGRYGALPVVWCTAGEANLPWYLASGFPYDDREQVKGWTEVTRYLRAADPFHRLITIHPTGIGRLSARNAINDTTLIDIDMLQTPHGRLDAVAPTVRTMRESYADRPVMPIINGEASFEMLGDNLPTEWTRRMFWLCMLNGAAGHTYGANGIWQVNRPNDPHGPSPHHKGGFGYGRIPWDEAMNLGGSTQVALGRKIFEQYTWQKFTPHPEWAAFAEQATLELERASWIWYPEGNPAADAPAEKRFFRRSFDLPATSAVRAARMRISADDRFEVWFNGKSLGSSGKGSDSWKTGRQFGNFVSGLRTGPNRIAVAAQNLPAQTANPAGLIVRLEMEMADGTRLEVDSDASWESAKNPGTDWREATPKGGEWTAAAVVAKYGEGPWGQLDRVVRDETHGPQSAGIAGSTRFIYVPENELVLLKNLDQGVSYAGLYYDPLTGEKKKLGRLQADQEGMAEVRPPTGNDHDWLLVLEPESK